MRDLFVTRGQDAAGKVHVVGTSKMLVDSHSGIGRS
jgi:hypothetical protein